MADGPYELNEDGTPKDPVAFREALRNDPEKMEAIDDDPDVKSVVLGDDLHAFQELVKNAYHAEMKRLEKQQQTLSERTIDAQRASAPVPRDTVQLYAQLRESGLQYGPAFRLLRNVHVPDV
eukprot:jgi/Botrbrau1/17330/Bobra.0015s0076.1